MTITLETKLLTDPGFTSRWRQATWEDYEQLRDDPTVESVQLFFLQNQLWVENMGGEGIQHAKVADLLRLVVGLWLLRNPDLKAEMMSNCLLEKAQVCAAIPDLAVYVGQEIPSYQPGEARKIELNRHRPPDLVGESADTTLTSDLDQKKKLYAEIGVQEYWVIDGVGQRVFAFCKQPETYYELIEESVVLG